MLLCASYGWCCRVFSACFARDVQDVISTFLDFLQEMTSRSEDELRLVLYLSLRGFLLTSFRWWLPEFWTIQSLHLCNYATHRELTYYISPWEKEHHLQKCLGRGICWFTGGIHRHRWSFVCLKIFSWWLFTFYHGIHHFHHHLVIFVSKLFQAPSGHEKVVAYMPTCQLSYTGKVFYHTDRIQQNLPVHE